MRPFRLTMQAFGPYPGREVVDFRDAVKAGLFGIYGQTGSGKSTLFSAMTFALFGAPAKPDQEAPSLRSDHADAGVHTEVEFVFEVGDRRYVVLRRPEQMRPKQRGDGETRNPHEAFLFDATGVPFDEITEFQRGKIIAEKKVGIVDAAVQDLLGYGPDQFRQIVLLPQGRFETFLAAKTPDRLKILRELFDVSLYRNLTTTLKASAEAAERRVSHEREICAGRLISEGFESTDALVSGISDAQSSHATLLESEKAARETYNAAQTVLREGEALEARFKSDESARAALTLLEAGNVHMDALANRVLRAERARLLLDPEANVIETSRDVRSAEDEQKMAREAFSDAEQKATSAAETLREENARLEETEGLRQRAEELRRHQLVLEKAVDAKTVVQQAQAAERLAAINLNDSRQRSEELQEKQQENIEALEEAKVAEGQRQRLHTLIAHLKLSLTVAETFERAEAGVTTAQIAANELIDEYAKAKDLADAARKRFEEAEKSLAEEQALHLASKLHAGDACPVCGSTEHPAPATGIIENVGREQALREVRHDLQSADSTLRGVEQKLTAARSVLQERQERLAGLDRPEERAATIKNRLHTESQSLNDLDAPIDIETAEAEIEQLGLDIASLAEERDMLQGASIEAQRTTATASARLNEMLSVVPESLRDAGVLATTLESAAKALALRRTAKVNAEAAATSTREAELLAQKDYQAAGTALEACQQRQAKAAAELAARLTQSGLSEDEFRSLKPSIATIDDDRAIIEAHHRKVDTARETARVAAEAIREQVRPDLTEILEKLGDAEANLTAATNLRSGTHHRLEHLTKLRDGLAETLRILDEAEAASGPLRHLAALLNGENPQKLDIETFAIGAMFDQVLEAANLRLGPMTANRYRLERDLEGGGRGRRGLGIQVADIFTGRARPTTTLSGGETFIAALALALGLADVVESASGKVRLDTIFIDEGFGSLDTENGSGTLDQVLQVLSSLVSQNRAVGVISHVPLVQEAIPNGFYVRKHLAGSSVEAKGLV